MYIYILHNYSLYLVISLYPIIFIHTILVRLIDFANIDYVITYNQSILSAPNFLLWLSQFLHNLHIYI